jgi:hypothetical protein
MSDILFVGSIVAVSTFFIGALCGAATQQNEEQKIAVSKGFAHFSPTTQEFSWNTIDSICQKRP